MADKENPVSGRTDGLSQDYNGKLGKWFADRLGAREQLRRDMPPAAPADMVMVPREILMRALELLSCIGCSPEGAEHDVRDAAKLQEDIKPFIAAAPAPADTEGCAACATCGQPWPAAPAVPADQWEAAIDDELVCCHIGTTDSFPDAKAALKNLIDWHVSVALDPAVSSDAQALIDKALSAVPLTDEQIMRYWKQVCNDNRYNFTSELVQALARSIEQAHGIGGSNG